MLCCGQQLSVLVWVPGHMCLASTPYLYYMCPVCRLTYVSCTFHRNVEGPCAPGLVSVSSYVLWAVCMHVTRTLGLQM